MGWYLYVMLCNAILNETQKKNLYPQRGQTPTGRYTQAGNAVRDYRPPTYRHWRPSTYQIGSH